ncbi:MAG: sugar transferase [Candidatus Omnitrophica bacterium]|nr:sugar transferase [Candidatus Omnitrophota bacterium]
MIRPLRKVYVFYIFVDVAVIILSCYTSYVLKYNSLHNLFNCPIFPFFRDYSFAFILWAIFLVISLKRRGLYYTDRSLGIPKEIERVFFCVLNTGVLVGAVVFFSQYKFFSREVFVETNILIFISLSAWRTVKRIILRRMIAQGLHNINVVIVGAGKIGSIALSEIQKVPWLGLWVVGFLDDTVKGEVLGVPVVGTLADFSRVAKKYFVDEIIITIPSEIDAVIKLIKEAKEHSLAVRVVPQDFEEPLAVSEINHLGILPLLTYKSRKPHPTEYFLKRLFDFFISLVVLIILLPVFLVIAVLIKLDSKGPVFYVQKRVGFKGRIFNMYKFRSMIVGADNLKEELLAQNEVKDGVIFKIKKDPRVTPTGAFLRKFSFDELPQLVNVVKGDMSLVGPRPPTVDEVRQYDFDHMTRLAIRPGMTGLSQVRGRSALSFRKWVKWDVWYINNWSFGLDLKILWWTVPAVLKGRGAY